jgi:membrane protein DedA with SNARE-associated domain
VGTIAAITVASGTWYGLVTWIAFRAGSNWDDLARNIGRMGRWTALAAVVLAAGLAFTWYRHRRARHEPDRAA